MYSYTPPVPPPKPGSHETSRMGTPSTSQSPRPPPIPDYSRPQNLPEAVAAGGARPQAGQQQQQVEPDPGDQWLPRFLEDKSWVTSRTAITSRAHFAFQDRGAG